MKRLIVVLCAILMSVAFSGSAGALSVSLYVDAAPNVYGSPDYDPWQTNAFAQAVNGTFINMANSINPANAGTTDFEIQDEVVYSFGDLGKRLTWIYWIPDATIDDLTGSFKISLFNVWDGDSMDCYNDWYGSTWLEPTKWVEYQGGVIGTAGMAWWGAHGVNTQDALDADIASWGLAQEDWILTARLNGEEFSITSHRDPVPEPSTIVLLAVGCLGLVFRKKLKKS